MVAFSEAYGNELRERYGFDISDQITGPTALRYAAIPGYEDEWLPYLRVRPAAPDSDSPDRGAVLERPVVYIPGFTEGMFSKAPLAGELARQGIDIILPDQNRAAILSDALGGEKDATSSQARNYLAVLRTEWAEGLDGGVDFVAHSYGALILSRMAQLEPDLFANSRAVLLAPAGISRENPISLGGRFARMLWSERSSRKDFPDATGEMAQAGLRNLTANIPRTVRELLHLTRERIDVANLLYVTAGRVAVLSFAQDELYSDRVLSEPMRWLVEAGVTWSVPVSMPEQTALHASTLYVDGATHNDDQFNPLRVAGAIKAVLMQPSGTVL